MLNLGSFTFITLGVMALMASDREVRVRLLIMESVVTSGRRRNIETEEF